MTPVAAATLSGDAFRALFPEVVSLCSSEDDLREKRSDYLAIRTGGLIFLFSFFFSGLHLSDPLLSLPPLFQKKKKFYARHLAQGTRPDGRSPTEARSLSISLGAVGGNSTSGQAKANAALPLHRLLSAPPCDGSALVRCGGTAAVAAVTFEVAAASEHAPAAGALSVSVDFPPLSSADARPGGGGSSGGPERLRGLASSVLSDLRSCGSVDETDGTLCIKSGVAVFVARVDVLFLSTDGGERGVALFAAAAALADARPPAVEISGGSVVRVDGNGGKGGEAGPGAEPGGSSRTTAAAAATEPSPSERAPLLSPSGPLLRSLPVASTLATHGSTAVFDPDAGESEIAHSSVTVVVRSGDGALLGVEGGARRSVAGETSRGDGSGSGGDGKGGKENESSFGGVIPLSVLSQAVLLGRARAAEAAEALAAALEARRKS